MKKLHVRKDDVVVVISGDDKGTKGKVLAVSPEEGKVIVEGANIVSKHNKARKQGEVSSIVKTEGAMYASKVQLYCPACNRGCRVRAEIKTDAKGNKTKNRVCVKCGKVL